VTLHDDGVRAWSTQGELRHTLPIDCADCASGTQVAHAAHGSAGEDSRHTVHACGGGVVCHSVRGANHVHVSRVTATATEAAPSSVVVPSAGPVECVAASSALVAIGTSMNPRRGALMVVAVSGGWSRSTWLPPDRYAIGVAFVSDVSQVSCGVQCAMLRCHNHHHYHDQCCLRCCCCYYCCCSTTFISPPPPPPPPALTRFFFIFTLSRLWSRATTLLSCACGERGLLMPPC
jgi:hypothetical protein